MVLGIEGYHGNVLTTCPTPTGAPHLPLGRGGMAHGLRWPWLGVKTHREEEVILRHGSIVGPLKLHRATKRGLLSLLGSESSQAGWSCSFFSSGEHGDSTVAA